jgi:saccharopine dehydrogenase-like NADP-dependent oxidoreductase
LLSGTIILLLASFSIIDPLDDMQTILVAGAGKSSVYLIQYLLSHASRKKWKIIIADGDAKAISEKINGSSFAEKAVIDITNEHEREPLVKRADIVLSLMPAHLHILLAKDCLKHKKHLITSSYISPEMKAMEAEVKKAGLMFMCEMGLDPGIDHMTASHIIHGIQRVAGIITSFKSYCGGLVAPESDTNPWHYKFSWNPRNVVVAGYGGAKYLLQGKEVEVPYDKMFEDNKKIKIDESGSLAYYPNRDSLRYLELYDVPEIKTFMRATLRNPAFCKGWDALIKLGLTNDKDAVNTQGLTYAGWLKNKSGYKTGSLIQHIAQKVDLPENDKVISMIKWLGLFDDKQITSKNASSADVLLEVLLDKWKMQPEDKDMVVMQHEVEYLHKERKTKLTSTMTLTGESSEFSAMAKTVGLPIGILAKLVLDKRISLPNGVLIPNMAPVYRPVLTELKHYGISFTDEIE